MQIVNRNGAFVAPPRARERIKSKTHFRAGRNDEEP
jgi:hypothetical protein